VLSKHLDDLEQTLHYGWSSVDSRFIRVFHADIFCLFVSEIRAHLQPHDQTGAVLTDAQYARQHARLIGRGNQRARNPINRTAAETTNDSDPDTDDGQTADDVDDNEDSEQSRQQQAPQRRRIPVRESINLRDSQRGATKSIRTTGNNRPRQPVVYPEHLPPEHLRPAPIEEDAEIGEFEPFEVEVDEPQKTEQEEAVEDCLRWRTVFTHLRYLVLFYLLMSFFVALMFCIVSQREWCSLASYHGQSWLTRKWRRQWRHVHLPLTSRLTFRASLCPETSRLPSVSVIRLASCANLLSTINASSRWS
jgi:hypothetical protein